MTNTEFFASPTTSGKTVTERFAMQMTAVYACVRILADAVASLPIHLYQERAGTTVCPIVGLYCRSVLGCTGVPEGAQVTAL
ncbi:hypothetical protein [uncultured Rothia sp.]|uniref:hypothetical protein n=1 Tax=uncultured Rothia sp. TaxID=316088 RepID=UPI0025FEBF1F|nr:hypothetical protein [uncultured Rothia sp.]